MYIFNYTVIIYGGLYEILIMNVNIFEWHIIVMYTVSKFASIIYHQWLGKKEVFITMLKIKQYSENTEKITIQKIAIVFNNCNLITKDTYNISFIRSYNNSFLGVDSDDKICHFMSNTF